MIHKTCLEKNYQNSPKFSTAKNANRNLNNLARWLYTLKRKLWNINCFYWMNKNIYYHSKGKNCKSLTKCLTEVKTKFNSVYIKPHAYKPYMSKSIHITIEICRNRSSSKTKWWWIKNQVMFGILSPLLQQKEAQGTNWNKKVYCRIFLGRTPKNPNVILATCPKKPLFKRRNFCGTNNTPFLLACQTD